MILLLRHIIDLSLSYCILNQYHLDYYRQSRIPDIKLPLITIILHINFNFSKLDIANAAVKSRTIQI